MWCMLFSGLIIKCSPFCKKDLLFKEHVNTPELQSVNHVSNVSQHDSSSRHVSKSTQSHNSNSKDKNDETVCNPDNTTAITTGVVTADTEMESTAV